MATEIKRAAVFNVICFSFFFYSCSTVPPPDPAPSVYGIVVDTVSGLPVSNAEVSYHESYGLWTPSSATLATTYTDSKGEFNMTWRESNEFAWATYVEISKNGYSYAGYGRSVPFNHYSTFYITPLCYVKMRIKNIDPHTTDDLLWIIEYLDHDSNVTGSPTFSLQGIDMDTTIVFQRVSLQDDSLVFDVYKSLVDTYSDTSFYLSPYDTIKLDLLY